MKRASWISPLLMAVVVAVGCGAGKSPEASATTDQATESTRTSPVQLAQTPAASPPVAQATSQHAGGSASIRGTVRLAGTAPKREPIPMSADPVCQQQHPTPVLSGEAVVSPEGGLQYVFVYVKEGVTGSFPAPTTPVTLDQTGCWYHPHVFGIQVNQPLEIVNNDPTLHNVNAKPTVNQPFNIAQPVKGMKTKKAFTKPEVMVRFKCNVHPWMQAYAGVVEHPFFAVTDEKGVFAIEGLPDGQYVLEAWHEKFGAQTQHVTIAGGEAKSTEWTFTAQ